MESENALVRIQSIHDITHLAEYTHDGRIERQKETTCALSP